MDLPKHPDINVDLSAGDGNVFAIIGTMINALRRAKVPEDEVQVFVKEARSSDYDHLLQTCMAWVNVR